MRRSDFTARAGRRRLVWLLAALLLLPLQLAPMGERAAADPVVTANGVFVAPTSDDFVPGLMATGYLFGSGKKTGSLTIAFDVAITEGLPTGNVGFGAYVTSLQSRPIDVAFEGRPTEAAYKQGSAGGVQFPFDTGDQFHFAFSVDTSAQTYGVVVTKGAAQLVNVSNVGFSAADIGMLGVRNHAGGSFVVKNLTVNGVAEHLVNAVDDVNNPPSLTHPAGNLFQVGPGHAFRKIQDVISLLQPGDTVEVDAGAYPGGVFLPASVSGTETQPITIRGIKDGQGNRPVIKAMGATNNVEAQANNLVLESLDIVGNQDELLAETGTSYSQLQSGAVNNQTSWWNARITQRGIFHRDHNLVIRDCLVHGVGSGIPSSDGEAGSITIEYSEIFDNGTGNGAHNLYLTTAQLLYPDAVARIRFNYIHDELGSGANIKTRATRNEIYFNRIENARDLAMELTGPDGDAIKDLGMGYDVEVNSFREDSDVVGNLIVESDGSWGVRMGGDKNLAQTYGRYRFVNNTFVTGGGSPLRVETGTIESLELYNNIFYSGVSTGELFRVRDPGWEYWSAWSNGVEQVYGSNNWIADAFAGGIPGGLQNTTRGVDPGFNDIAGGDYSLQYGTNLPGVPLGQTQHTFPLWTANGGQGHEINGYEQPAWLTDIDTAFPNPYEQLYYTPVNRNAEKGYRDDALDPADAPTAGAYPAMLPSEEVVDGKVVHNVFAATPTGGTIDLSADKAGEGDDIAVTATAAGGYYFTGWTVSGEGASVSSAKSAAAKLTMGTADATIGATFAQAGGFEPEKRYLFDGTLNNIRAFKYWGDPYLPEARYLVKSVDGTVTMHYDGEYWKGYDAGNNVLFQLHHAAGTDESAASWSRVGGYAGPVPFDEGSAPAAMKFTISATGGTDATLFDLFFFQGADTNGLTDPVIAINARVNDNPADTVFMLAGTNKNNDPLWQPIASAGYTTDHIFSMYNNNSTAGMAIGDNGELKAFAWAGDYSGMTADIAEIYFAGPGTTPIGNTLSLSQPTGGTINIDGLSGEGGGDRRYIFDGTLNNIRPFQYWGGPYLPETRYLVKSVDGTVTMHYDGEYWKGYDAGNNALFQLHHATGTAENDVSWSRVGSYAGPVPYDEGTTPAAMKFTIQATGGSDATLFDLFFFEGADTTGIDEPKIVIDAKVPSNPGDTAFMLTGTNKNTDPQWQPVAGSSYTTDHLFWMYDNVSSTGMALADNGELKAMTWAGDYSGMTADIQEIYFAGEGGGTSPVEGADYAPGDAVGVTATAQAGYTFIGWQTLGGGSFADAASASTDFYMPADDVTITALYVAQGSEPLSGIGVDYAAMDRTYVIGDTLDLTGLEVDAYYAGLANPVPVDPQDCVYYAGESGPLSYVQAQSHTLAGPAGNYKIKVEYTDGTTRSAAFNIRVGDPVALSGVVLAEPYKTLYAVGAGLELRGMEVAGLYSDGSHHLFAANEYAVELFVNGAGSGASVADGDPLTQTGTHRIEVTAAGITKSFLIEVE